MTFYISPVFFRYVCLWSSYHHLLFPNKHSGNPVGNWQVISYHLTRAESSALSGTVFFFSASRWPWRSNPKKKRFACITLTNARGVTKRNQHACTILKRTNHQPPTHTQIKPHRRFVRLKGQYQLVILGFPNPLSLPGIPTDIHFLVEMVKISSSSSYFFSLAK